MKTIELLPKRELLMDNILVEKFKSAYFFFENKYYELLDKVNKYVPIYKVVDPIDKVVPSFALLIGLILLLAIVFIFFSTTSIALIATLQVVDNKGNALEGVSVDLTVDNQTKQLSTDDWGEVQLSIPKQEVEAQARFSKEGFQDLERAVFLTADEITSVTMQPVVPPLDFKDAEKTIKVIDSSTNRAVKGVTLSFECVGGGFAPKSQKGDTGEFKVVQPSNCPTLIAAAEAPGYSKASKTLSTAVTHIKLSANTQDTTGRIAVIVRDNAGSAEPDVVVRAIDEVRNTEAASSSTTLSGTALLEELQPGGYTVSASSPDGRTGQKAGVLVTAGETATVTINLPSADEVDVKKIYLKLIEQGTSNAVAEAQAFIYEDSVLVDSTTSDSLGIVEKKLSNPDSTYLVVLTHPDFVTRIEPNVPLKELSDTDPISVPMVRATMEQPNPTSTEAVVTVVDEDLEPVEDALVTLYSSQYPEIPLKSPPGKTLEDGAYTFSNLAPGTYFARAQGEDGTAEGESDSGTVAAGETLELQVTLVLGQGTVEVTVFDRDSAFEEPIPAAEVQFIDSDDISSVLASCTTDETGKCESEPIPADEEVFVKASAAGFIPGWATSTIDLVNKNTAKVNIGLTHETSIPPTVGGFDTRFVAFCEDKDCEKSAGRIQSDETGTLTYFAKFELIFSKDVSYVDPVQHVRAGPDSEINLPLPNGYRIRIMNVTGPLFTVAPLSNCWNNDQVNPFTEPADCSTDSSAKQANIYYPDLQGKQIVPFVVEFDVEPGLEEGTRLEMHYIAKATSGDQPIVTSNKVKIFLVDEALCDGRQFSWSFSLENPDGSTTVLDTAPGALNSLAMNETYSLSYRVYNCSGRDYSNAMVTAENPAPNAISFAALEPFDFGPTALQGPIPFQSDTEISYTLPIYTVTETTSTGLQFTLDAGTQPSIETIGFSIESGRLLGVEHMPGKLSPNVGSQSLVGRVTDALQPSTTIEGATVILEIEEGRTMTAVTDAEGHFTISGIGQLDGLSSVTLTVRKAGYRVFEKEIEIGVDAPIPNPNLDCISIEMPGEEEVEIYFDKPALGAAVPSSTFTVVNGCNESVVISLDSELEVLPSSEFTLAAGNTMQVTVYAETTTNAAYPIYMGEYGIGVMARFAADDPLAGFAGPIQTARIYVTDPNSSFRLADPLNPSDPGATKSTFDIRSGADDGLIVNKDFAYFEDLRMPRLEKVRDYSPVEAQFSLIYEPPTQPGVEVEKQRVLDPFENYFAETSEFIFELVDNAGYVFVDWVDFLMTDEGHNTGDRHMVWAQTHRDVWSNITAQLPYTPVTRSKDLPEPIYPIVDNFGWVDTDTYYPDGARYDDEVTKDPMWQGQHNVCNTNLKGFGSTLGECSIERYFNGKSITPYKIGSIANKISLESEGNLATKLSAVRWKYIRTDADHGGWIDFSVMNNTLMGDAYALIEVEDTVSVQYVLPGGAGGGVSVEWILSKRGVLINSNVLTVLDSATTVDQNKVLAVSVEGTSQVFDNPAGICEALSPDASKELTSVEFTSNAESPKFQMPPGLGRPNIAFYTCFEGALSEPIYFDLEEPGETDTLSFDQSSDVEILVFENNSDDVIIVDGIAINYLTREEKSVRVASGTADIPLGQSLIEFDPPNTGIDLPPGIYESTEYFVEDITPEGLVYFSDTKTNVSPDPYASGAKIVAATSSPEEESISQMERFHVRLVGQSQEQCMGQGGLRGSTGPGAKPRVLFDWAWDAIEIDSCNDDNPNFVYCDPTQLTISLVKRLELMRQLAEEDITGNLLKLREMQAFNAYLIEDAYSEDFRSDFVEFFEKEFLSDELTNPQHPWSEYVLDSERLVFETGAESKLVNAGLHEVYIDLQFDEDQFDFFYVQGTGDEAIVTLLADITVYVTKLSDPVIRSPFYYLPFNGEVGKLLTGEFDRQGYGLEFDNMGEPLAIVGSPDLGVFHKTDSSNGLKLVATEKISDFDSVNIVDRGMIMRVAQNQAEIKFLPSIATPLLLQMISQNGKVEAYYWLRDLYGDVPVSGASFMNLWNGTGSTMRSSSGECLDYYGSKLSYRIQDRVAGSATCASSVPSSYGFNYDPAQEGQQLYFETVFYVPESLAINLRKSCQNNSYLYAPPEPGSEYPQRTDTVDTPVSLSLSNSRTRVATMEDVVNLIADEYVCISADDEFFSFWWNPQKVLEELEVVKQSIPDWESLSCLVAEAST